MQRISIVGSSCSGKTTLSRTLAGRLNLPHIELDALYWGPDWSHATNDAFRARVRDVTAADRWIIDGNYSLARDIVLARADTLIWLDLPFVVVFSRTVRRTLSRAVNQEPLWHGNVERWRQVFSRDGLIWWVITTHRSRRRRWEAWLRRPEAGHLRVIRLRSRRAIREWLATAERQPQGA